MITIIYLQIFVSILVHKLKTEIFYPFFQVKQCIPSCNYSYSANYLFMVDFLEKICTQSERERFSLVFMLNEEKENRIY